MNIACIIRGPIRPNHNSVINNINTFLESFKDFKENIDLYLCTWEEYSQSSSEIKKHFDDINVITTSLEKNPVFGQKYLFNKLNCYRQFISAKFFISSISKLKKYDFLIHTRTDMRMKIEPKEWFNQNFYTTIHSGQNLKDNWQNFSGEHFTNDQFSVAQPEIMEKAWDYGTEKELIELIDTVPFPEKILDFNIEKNKVFVKVARPLIWNLDYERHKG